MGTLLGNDIYKIRVAIASKNKGKSGGARVLSFVKVTLTTILLSPSITTAKLTALLIRK